MKTKNILIVVFALVLTLLMGAWTTFTPITDMVDNDYIVLSSYAEVSAADEFYAGYYGGVEFDSSSTLVIANDSLANFYVEPFMNMTTESLSWNTADEFYANFNGGVEFEKVADVEVMLVNDSLANFYAEPFQSAAQGWSTTDQYYANFYGETNFD